MHLFFRTRLETFLAPQRHLAWRILLSGCSFFWIVLVVSVMGIRT